MDYTKTTWKTGDVITAEKMNNLEDGVEDLAKENTELKSDISNLQDLGLIIKNGVVYDRWEEK